VKSFTKDLREALPDAVLNVDATPDDPYKSTKAFEVLLGSDKKVIFSKKATGRFPTVDEIVPLLG